MKVQALIKRAQEIKKISEQLRVGKARAELLAKVADLRLTKGGCVDGKNWADTIDKVDEWQSLLTPATDTILKGDSKKPILALEEAC